MAVLTLDRVTKRFDSFTAVDDLSFEVPEGGIFGFLGANGAGKTTTLGAISGLLRPQAGSITFDGAAIGGLAVERIVRLGIAHCPEGRRVFPGLTVMENLRAGGAIHPARTDFSADLDLIFTLFPRLAERRKQRGWSLSGGEQQMLAVGRALMSRPKLLLLDEPSLGLAPLLVEQMFAAISQLNRETGLAILLVEQNAALALDVAHRAYVLETGSVRLSGPAADLAADPRIREAYFGE